MRRKRLAMVLVASLVVVYAGLTVRQIRVWHDSISLWTAVLARSPDSVIAHNNLAVFLADHSRDDEALAHEHRAIIASTGPAASRHAVMIACSTRTLVVRSLLATGRQPEAMAMIREIINGPCKSMLPGAVS